MAVSPEMMRILFLLPECPYPASTGGRLKIYNELLYLSEHHQCDILCFNHPDKLQVKELASALPKVRILSFSSISPGIFRLRLNKTWGLFRALPPSLAVFFNRSYAGAVSSYIAIGDYDVVHYDIVNMAQYLPFGSSLPSVHSPNDATSLVYFRVAKYMAWSFAKMRLLIVAFLLQRFERLTYPLFTTVHVCAAEDAEYLQQLDPTINISTIPIAISGEFLIRSQQKENRDFELGAKIICTGNLGNPAIAAGVEDFLLNALPSIVTEVPNVQFVLLGQNTSSAFRKIIKDSSNVSFLTWVDDYRCFLAEADIVLVPDCTGPSGAKTRAVQAMSLGLPVVGTTSALEGISLIDGEHALVYKTMHECIELVLKLLNSKKLRKILSENAHRLAVQEFSLVSVGPRYENLYIDAISRHRSLFGGSHKDKV
jgi:polysaccharide biosynthesis protein PslH